MKNIPLYIAMGLLAILLAAQAVGAEDASTVTALLPPGDRRRTTAFITLRSAESISGFRDPLLQQRRIVDFRSFVSGLSILVAAALLILVFGLQFLARNLFSNLPD
jgi:hypothetical protein